jgi:hypothetical protein
MRDQRLARSSLGIAAIRAEPSVSVMRNSFTSCRARSFGMPRPEGNVVYGDEVSHRRSARLRSGSSNS